MKYLLVLLILCETAGLVHRKLETMKKALVFYTQLSNIAVFVSAVLLLCFGPHTWITALRYLSVCMTTMTALVVVFVLLPISRNTHLLFLCRTGFFLHVLCPLLNLISYFAFEEHASAAMIALPLAVTVIYADIMLYGNYAGTVDGPYPFFRVRNQTKKATLIWMIVLFSAILAISLLIWALG